MGMDWSTRSGYGASGKITSEVSDTSKEKAMHAIRKKIVVDEDSHPVAVQIDYEDWLEIERLLNGQSEKEATKEQEDDFEELADRLGEMWEGGEGLSYQIRMREEWDHR